MWDEKVPPTVKLNVTAKLSMPHDAHIACKANNYQFFPVHLFERWSGYNIIQLPMTWSRSELSYLNSMDIMCQKRIQMAIHHT